jgi:hypothetical protein
MKASIVEAKKRPSHKLCQFCEQWAAAYEPIEKMEKHGIGVYFCHICRAEYLFFDKGETFSYSLYTEINGKMYRWTCNAQCCLISYVESPGVPGISVNQNISHIKVFWFSDGFIDPKLTPKNVNQKLKTWITFS